MIQTIIPQPPNIFFELGRPTYFNKEIGLYSGSWIKQFPYMTEVPYCDPNIIISHINKKLENIKGINFTFNKSHSYWSLEYKKKPVEQCLWFDIDNYDEKRELIKRKNGILTARKALNMKSLKLDVTTQMLKNLDIQEFANDEQLTLFNIIDEDIIDELQYTRPIPLLYDSKWAKIEIWLLYNEYSNSFFVEYIHLKGDKPSFYLINEKIDKTLNEPKFLNWIKRYTYLMFTEGITYDHTNKCLRYLCDEIIIREILQYL